MIKQELPGILAALWHKQHTDPDSGLKSPHRVEPILSSPAVPVSG